MITKTILSFLTAWSISSSSIFSAALVFNIDSGSNPLRDKNGLLLSGGIDTARGDGAVFQLGYFTGATSDGNNFAGAWVPITGQGSANFVDGSAFDTTIGDNPSLVGGGGPGTADGLFVIADFVIQDTALTLPQAGTILSLRIFDKTSLTATGNNFMTLSNNLWKWKTPGSLTDPNSTVNISLDQTTGLRMENRSGAGGLASTASGDTASASPRPTIPFGVPEPSCSLLAFAGIVTFLARRRNK